MKQTILLEKKKHLTNLSSAPNGIRTSDSSNCESDALPTEPPRHPVELVWRVSISSFAVKSYRQECPRECVRHVGVWSSVNSSLKLTEEGKLWWGGVGDQERSQEFDHWQPLERQLAVGQKCDSVMGLAEEKVCLDIELFKTMQEKRRRTATETGLGKKKSKLVKKAVARKWRVVQFNEAEKLDVGELK